MKKFEDLVVGNQLLIGRLSYPANILEYTSVEVVSLAKASFKVRLGTQSLTLNNKGRGKGTSPYFVVTQNNLVDASWITDPQDIQFRIQKQEKINKILIDQYQKIKEKREQDLEQIYETRLRTLLGCRNTFQKLQVLLDNTLYSITLLYSKSGKLKIYTYMLLAIPETDGDGRACWRGCLSWLVKEINSQGKFEISNGTSGSQIIFDRTSPELSFENVCSVLKTQVCF